MTGWGKQTHTETPIKIRFELAARSFWDGAGEGQKWVSESHIMADDELRLGDIIVYAGVERMLKRISHIPDIGSKPTFYEGWA